MNIDLKTKRLRDFLHKLTIASQQKKKNISVARCLKKATDYSVISLRWG